MRKKIILTICFLAFSYFIKATPFVTVWDLSIPGSGSNQIAFGVGTTGIVSYTWETIPAGTTGSGTFNAPFVVISGLPTNAKIRLSIDSTNFKKIWCYASGGTQNDLARLLDIEKWGSVKWNSMFYAFSGCINLNVSSIDVPDLTNVTEMSYMFSECFKLNGPLNIGNWNTSNITDMSGIFFRDSAFNQSIENWNTNKVTSMERMFFEAKNFNQLLNNWIIDSVIDMSSIFEGASSFNQSIANWKLNSIFYYGTNSMFNYSGMDCSNYSSTLKGWANNPNLPSNKLLGSANIHYGLNAIADRNFLISKGWTINGDIANNYDCYPTSISTIESQNAISNFYPNPTSSNASIDIFSEKNEKANIEVYNTLGQMVFNDKIKLQYGKNIIQLNTQNFTNGIYSVSIKIGEKQIVKQLAVSQ